MNSNELVERTENNFSTADLLNRENGTAQRTEDQSTQPAHEPLFAVNESETFRGRWHDIQGGFVDEPKMAVKQADELVASVIKRLTEVFAGERDKMERSWAQGGDPSTEDLRQALRRYRSFFDRLLSV